MGCATEANPWLHATAPDARPVAGTGRGYCGPMTGVARRGQTAQVAVDPPARHVVGDGLPAGTQQICGLVAELNRRIEANVRHCGGDLNLTVTQANALRALESPLSMRELADRLLCEPSNVTFVMDRLVRQGLVERRNRPHDRRVRELVLTAAGRRLRHRLMEALAAHSPLSHLGEDERVALRDMLLRAVERG